MLKFLLGLETQVLNQQLTSYKSLKIWTACNMLSIFEQWYCIDPTGPHSKGNFNRICNCKDLNQCYVPECWAVVPNKGSWTPRGTQGDFGGDYFVFRFSGRDHLYIASPYCTWYIDTLLGLLLPRKLRLSQDIPTENQHMYIIVDHQYI